jgi:chloramphenicol-sensitive protein RarD
VATAIPLLFFAAAARRVPLSVLGMLQYLAPVLQFLTGVLVYDEPMPASRLAGFALVWAALVLLTAESLRHRRRLRRAAATPAAAAGSYS